MKKESIPPQTASMEDIVAHRAKFYENLKTFFDENPASPKLVASLLAEASGYAIARAPKDKHDQFTAHAHETLDKALNQQTSASTQ